MKKKKLIYFSQIFRDDLSKLIGPLDYSFESLRKIEVFISKTIPSPGRPIRNSFFFTDTLQRTFGLACYTGEVIRRSLPNAKWNIDKESDSPWTISLTNSTGAIGFVMNKVYSRIYFDVEDNLFYFSKVMADDQLMEDEITTSHLDDEDKNILKYGNSRICIISNEIYQGNLDIYEANYSDDIWLFTSQNENLNKENESTFNYIFLDEVKVKFPSIYFEIKKRVDGKRIRIVKENNGNYKFQKAYKNLFFDSSSMAHFQGDMQLNPLQWIKMNADKVLRITLYLIVSFVAMLKIHWIFVIVFIACLLYNIWYWFGTKSTFRGGNVCLGKVISINPDRIAVVTDLSKGNGEYPILKILETKVLKENREIGKFIPTVAIYNDNPHDYPFWSEFHPVPVSHGITDKNHLKYLMSKFSKSYFEKINEYLSQMSSKNIGTYKVDEESSDWKKFKHVDINKGVNLEGPIINDEN